MKAEALQNTAAPPITICQQALQTNADLGSFFGTSKQLIGVVTYVRRTKLHPYPAVNTSDVFFEVDGRFAQVKGDSMLLADWQDETHKQRIMILGTKKLFQQLCNSSLWIFDGTFRSCPKPFTQLTTIFGNKVKDDSYTSYGFLYILLTGKSLGVYQQLFKLICDIAQSYEYEIKLEYFLSDFELAISKAAAIQFPHIATFFCFFHYAQSMMKRIKKMGLWESFKVPQIRRWIELLFVLPLLPPTEIATTFDAIMLHDDFPDDLNPLYFWFAENYLKSKFNVFKWSVNFLLNNGLPKSQNFVESSHRKLNLILGVKQPKFYKVLNQLALQLIETEAQVEHHLIIGISPKKRVIKYIESDAKIRAIFADSSLTPFHRVVLLSKVLRIRESSRTQTSRAQNLQPIAENQLRTLPVSETPRAVHHPQVIQGTLPTRIRNPATNGQSQGLLNLQHSQPIPNVQNDWQRAQNNFEEHQTIYENVEYLEEYLDGSDEGLDEDDGYVSGADLDIQPADVPEQFQFVCELCRRTCKNQRGLKIHQASCRKKLRTN